MTAQPYHDLLTTYIHIQHITHVWSGVVGYTAFIYLLLAPATIVGSKALGSFSWMG